MPAEKSASEHGTEWAFRIFRPLLKDLHLQELQEKSYLRTSNKKYGLIRYHMERCIIVPIRYKFSNENDKGVFVWAYNRKRNLFILYIVINDNLYRDRMSHEDCVKRKLVTTHEFTHCTAAMLSLSGMYSEQLIESLQKSMRKDVDVIQSVDVDGIMSEFKKEIKKDDKTSKTDLSIRKFDDEHFRTNYEEFNGSYYDLNTNFLFSKQLFEEYFGKQNQQAFTNCIKQGAWQAAVTLLKTAVENVINEKHLDRKLVINKIQTDLLPYYLAEAAKHVNTNK